MWLLSSGPLVALSAARAHRVFAGKLDKERLIVILPPLLLFLALQRSFISGLTAGLTRR